MAVKRFALLDKCVCKGRDCFIVAIDFDGVNLPEYEIEYDDTGEREWVYKHTIKSSQKDKAEGENESA